MPEVASQEVMSVLLEVAGGEALASATDLGAPCGESQGERRCGLEEEFEEERAGAGHLRETCARGAGRSVVFGLLLVVLGLFVAELGLDGREREAHAHAFGDLDCDDLVLDLGDLAVDASSGDHLVTL